MRFRVILASSLLVCAASLLNAHDLFIKLETYFLTPHSSVTIPILNGSFIHSGNAIMRDRVTDISLVSSSGWTHVDTTAWAGDTNFADTTYLTIETGDPGTYIVGASTRPRDLGLAAADFNEYLEHDGIPDVLEARRANGELGKDVRERYAKHIKAVLQVGGKVDEPRAWWRFWQRKDPPYLVRLGYPAEIVPLVNPYSLTAGEEFSFLCLVDGEPVANQLVILGGEQGGALVEEVRKRTDEEGRIAFVIDLPGKWYIEFINMVPSPEEGVDYESKWATLAFEVR
ncbi:MAG: DUF4198 domain-containing protein [Gemmatimonadales bacterium]|nr:DUF4198 domain-containing protein [Gemmatimonadales bacterium]NIN13178.1 DUF4198 domain-containing protein [Gemmatimonadales bacterium]NIN51456.1 DUF4198 domain-containing protein [Gemmatimonadales bacterium]NIP08920.1 DUF4198 domain-containing protein [Gemmatimonadales bacterium]NIR03708.1 DUF4198 domain-containing protein [Gemmatimonadales bacterium]